MDRIRTKKACPKCGGFDFEIGEAYIAGSLLAKLFDIQNRKFTSLTCTKCHYTEYYKIPVKKIQNVLDLFTG
jgi:predicted nucleic-acid-binding Zn-ribbon protein